MKIIEIRISCLDNYVTLLFSAAILGVCKQEEIWRKRLQAVGDRGSPLTMGFIWILYPVFAVKKLAIAKRINIVR